MNVSASVLIPFPVDASLMKSSNLADTSTESSNTTDTSIELSTLTDTYKYIESNNLAGIIAPTIGVMTFICGFSFATTCICYHAMIRRKKALKKEKGVSKHMAAQIQECEEIHSDTWRSGRTFGLLNTFKGVIV